MAADDPALGRPRGSGPVASERGEVLALLPVGYLLLAADGVILDANQSAAALLGAEREALLQQPFERFVGSGDRDGYHLLRQRLLETGAQQAGDLHLITAAGAQAWAQAQLTRAAGQDGGAAIHAVLVDVTASKQNEAAAREALDRLQRVAARVPGVVYQFRLRPDGTSCFPFASEAINQIYRVTPEQVREDASAVFANLHPDDLAAVTASIERSARDLTPWQHEYRIRFGDGTVRRLFGDALP
jgi:PAS domain S-box-containing protein